jgi:hypothetical protein
MAWINSSHRSGIGSCATPSVSTRSISPILLSVFGPGPRMIVVNNPGSWDHVYWHGWTGADLIFPLFLFIVGVSMSFAFSDAKWRDGRLRSKVLRDTPIGLAD